MAGEIYAPIIEKMTWSYTRIKSFTECPYGWYLKYICHEEREPMFYASYGSFIHELLAQFYRGEIPKDKLKMRFLTGFSSEVQGRRPPGDIAASYVAAGLDYFSNFEPLPYKVLSVEDEFEFEFAGYPFRGYIDLVCEDDGDLIVVDHKSRKLKPRSKSGKRRASDDELDDMLRQLYIYSKAVLDRYGKLPKRLAFNCFRTNTLIEEPFSGAAYAETERWVDKNIKIIERSEDFYPNLDFFFCRSLCGLEEECCYFEMGKAR